MNYACKFCGQVGNLAQVMETEGNGIEAATMNCTCYESREYQTRAQNIERLGEAIVAFEKYCAERDVKLGETIAPLLTTIGTAVIDRQVTKNTMTFGRISIGFALTGKGNLSIGYKYAEAQKFEI